MDKYNLTQVYTNEFDSSGKIGSSVIYYLAFGIFLFQIVMCGIFTSIFQVGNLGIASAIVVFGEIFYMMVYRFFNTAELRETFDEILKDEGEELGTAEWE